MNTKMILEVAGAKPLATSCNTIAGAKGLVAEKGGRAVSKNFASSGRTATGGLVFPKMAQPTNAGTGEAVPGTAVGELGKAESLGEGMWRGVFGGVVTRQ